MMFFGVKENKQVFQMPVGTMGNISYQRLLEILRASGEFKNEEVTHLHFQKDGIAFRVEKKK